MSENKRPLGITDVVLRDAHQSLFATRMRIDDMLPIAEKLDQVGFWSLETWGGATFDACIRYLGEDPWERLRLLKQAMPNTPQQMLFRGQNILGYRHYADDLVEKFVERAAVNGVDVFRVFDAMNDPRNLETAIKAVINVDKHAQGTLSYTVSPVHTLDTWINLAQRLADMGAHSIVIKDMAGLLTPYVAYELVSRLKAGLSIPVHMHCHATTGLSTATILKAVEAGVDNVDTAISSMSMTYGHSPTESVVAMLQGSDRDPGLDLLLLEEIAAYFRQVRRKYAAFEGALKGVDSRILVAQVPGGMLTNMESQLREQGAAERLDEVLIEIPRVRQDLGYLPLVTPTSQIVGTQAVLNVLSGERYQNISRETAGVLKGEYGATPAPVDAGLQARVLEGAAQVQCRPADLLPPEVETQSAELHRLAREQGLSLASDAIDDVLTYALFPRVGLNFIKNRNNPAAFEPAPNADAATEVVSADSAAVDSAAVDSAAVDSAAEAAGQGPMVYSVTVNGQQYQVEVAEGGAISGIQAAAVEAPQPVVAGDPVTAPLAGTIFKVNVREGDHVQEGEVIVVLEAMKMETEVRAPRSASVSSVRIREGDNVAVGDELVVLA